MSNLLRKLSVAFLVVSLMGVASPGVFAAAGGADAHVNQRVEIFRNTSGSTLTSGTAVIYNFAASDAVTGNAKGIPTNLGQDVTNVTNLNAVSIANYTFAGILVDDSCPNGSLCRFVVSGVALATVDRCDTFPGSDVGERLGLSPTNNGQLASGTRVGIVASRAVDGTNVGANCREWILIDRQNAD